jgi:CheY-like chemotaxis protein
MSKHILLIDDDIDDAEIFSDAIDELALQAEVLHFVDGKQALQTLKENKMPSPDVIFLDINMPQISGWECLRELKNVAHLGKIPVIMYSTSDFAREGVSPADIGAAAFLTKPSDFEELKTKLTSLLQTFNAFQ